jgi:uracil-DNA glycosylase
MSGLESLQTYATNVFPFIKIGKKNAAIRAADMRYAAKKYALPQMKIVSPLMAVCLGPPAFLSMSRAALDKGGHAESKPLPHVVFCGIEIYAVSHPSMYPGGRVAVEGRWKQLGERLAALRERA